MSVPLAKSPPNPDCRIVQNVELEKSSPTGGKHTASRVALGKGQWMVRSVWIVRSVVIKTLLGKSRARNARLVRFKVKPPNLFVYLAYLDRFKINPPRRFALSVNVISFQVKRVRKNALLVQKGEEPLI